MALKVQVRHLQAAGSRSRTERKFRGSLSCSGSRLELQGTAESGEQ